MFARMAETVTKHSKTIIAIWVVIVVCCVPFMLKADSVLEYELTNMKGNDSESAQGNAPFPHFLISHIIRLVKTRFAQGLDSVVLRLDENYQASITKKPADLKTAGFF